MMAKRRGFLAELQYQAKQAERRRRQQTAAAQRANAAAQRESDRIQRAHLAAQREHERARRAYESAQTAALRASVANRKAAEKEAARLSVEARLAEVEELNTNLAAQYEDLDSLLTSTLDEDNHVDLAALKVTAVDHPPFEPGELAVEIAAVPAPQLYYAPVWREPERSFTVGAAIAGKRRHEKNVAEARAVFEATYAAWAHVDQDTRAAHSRSLVYRDQMEKVRQRKLAEVQAAYRSECEARIAQAEGRNAELDKLINGLAFDVESAIDEYVGIILANSVYPEAFPVDHDHAFTLQGRELTLTVSVPEPSSIPAVKEHKYAKATDEITTTALPVRERKGRYADAVWQVALRTLHEVFDGERAGKIHSVALTVAVETINAATGLPISIPLVIVAADREAFKKFDLSNVVPKATLEHLGAALSKSPFDLTPADASRGVRASRSV
jgi:restriction system protein